MLITPRNNCSFKNCLIAQRKLKIMYTLGIVSKCLFFLRLKAEFLTWGRLDTWEKLWCWMCGLGRTKILAQVIQNTTLIQFERKVSSLLRLLPPPQGLVFSFDLHQNILDFFNLFCWILSLKKVLLGYKVLFADVKCHWVQTAL